MSINSLGNPLGNALVLPREEPTSDVQVEVAQTPLFGSAFIPNHDGGQGQRIDFNTVISDVVAARAATSPFRISATAILRSHPSFTFINNQAVFLFNNQLSKNFVSLTYGSTGSNNQNGRIFGFSEDFYYVSQTSSSNTVPFPGFMLDGDADFYYIIGNSVVSKISKSTLTATLSRTYDNLQIVSAWIKGDDLVITYGNKFVVLDKNTLEVLSAFTLPSDATMIQVSDIRVGFFAQTEDLFGWVGDTSSFDRRYVYILNKNTLDVKRHTLSYGFISSRQTKLFACNNRICIVNASSGTQASGRVHQYTADQMLDLFYMPTGWSNQNVVRSGCWHEEDLLSLGNLSPTPTFSNPNFVEWSIRLSAIPNPLSIPSFSAISFQFRGNVAPVNLTAVTKTSSTATASSGTNTYTSLARFPYRTFY